MIILLVFSQSSFDVKRINFPGVLQYKKEGVLAITFKGCINRFWYLFGCSTSKEPGLSFRITFQSILLKQFDRI